MSARKAVAPSTAKIETLRNQKSADVFLKTEKIDSFYGFFLQFVVGKQRSTASSDLRSRAFTTKQKSRCDLH